jgi:hypothetical protein
MTRPHAGGHPRLTPSQKRVLMVLRSFDRPATLREIQLRTARLRGRMGRRR